MSSRRDGNVVHDQMVHLASRRQWNTFRRRVAKKLGRSESELVVSHADEYRWVCLLSWAPRGLCVRSHVVLGVFEGK